MCEVLIYCGGHPEPAAELSFVLILQLSFGVQRMGEGTSFWRFSEANKSCEWKYFFFLGGNINNPMTAHSLIYVLDLLQ